MPKAREHYTNATTDWSFDNQCAALDEGWGIFDNSDHGIRIERADDAKRFDCDEAAIAFVGHRAALGNALAAKAFAELAFVYAVSDAAEDDSSVQVATVDGSPIEDFIRRHRISMPDSAWEELRSLVK